MSDQHLSFMARALAGQAGPDDADEAVAAWHDGPSQAPLHEHLGMTAEEYSLWVVSPGAMVAILKARWRAMPLTRVVTDTLSAIQKADPLADDLDTRRLKAWLEIWGGERQPRQAGALASSAD